MNAHYLMIDDDHDLSELMQQYLHKFDIDLTLAFTPQQGLSLLKKSKFDLVILDVMLPQMDGFEVCKQIRKTSLIPILMLTARGDVSDKVLGLELGCDDYLAKPFEPRELVARCQSLVRRALQAQVGGTLPTPTRLKLDTKRLLAEMNQQSVELTAMEADALAYLMQHQGEVISRDTLLNQLKGMETEIFSRSIDILISRLRAKLKQLDPEPLIYTLRGKGYRYWENKDG